MNILHSFAAAIFGSGEKSTVDSVPTATDGNVAPLTNAAAMPTISFPVSKGHQELQVPGISAAAKAFAVNLQQAAAALPALTLAPEIVQHRTKQPANVSILESRSALLHTLNANVVSTASSSCFTAAQEETDGHARKVWTLMFSTDVCGRSFPRLVTALKRINGPSLIVIEELLDDQDTSNHDSSGPTPASAAAAAGSTSLSSVQQRYRSVFGAYTATRWMTVKDRELAGKATAAAKVRAARDGTNASLLDAASSSRPANHDTRFFGSSDCFIFTTNRVTVPTSSASSAPSPLLPLSSSSSSDASPAFLSSTQKGITNAFEAQRESTAATAPAVAGAAAASGSATAADDDQNKLLPRRDDDDDVDDDDVENASAPALPAASVFKPRTHGTLMNGNFMYFFDVHPTASLVGLGMGGNGAKGCVGVEQGAAFFLERSLTTGQACPGGCITFQGAEQLSRSPYFRIKAIEIWALDPAAIVHDPAHVLGESAAAAGSKKSSEGDVERQQHLESQSEAEKQRRRDDNFSSPALSNSKHAQSKFLMEMNGARMWSETGRNDV